MICKSMGSENLIIQTYGRNNYDEVEYEINGKKFKTKLTSEIPKY